MSEHYRKFPGIEIKNKPTGQKVAFCSDHISESARSFMGVPE